MRDPLLVFIKKDDEDETAKPEIDEVAKEVTADDDCISESPPGLHEVSPNISEFSAQRLEVSRIAKARNIQHSVKIIESRRNKRGQKVPKENFVKLTPEKGQSLHQDSSTVPKPSNTEIIESDEYLIITLKASRRKKIAKRMIPTTKSALKASESTVAIYEGKTEDLVLVSGSLAPIPSIEPIHHTTFLDNPSSENPEAIYTPVSPIVVHGAAKASEKYDEIPNEEFYAELRNFSKPTRWNKDIQKRGRSISSIPHSKTSSHISKLYPTKFATFLIRVERSPPKVKLPNEYEENTAGKDTKLSVKMESVDALQPSITDVEPQVPLINKCEEKQIESPKNIDAEKTIDVSTSTSVEMPPSSQVPSIETQDLDPLTMNPIKFRKELRALCRSKSHEEPIMVPNRETEKIAKSGAIPKTLASIKVKNAVESTPTLESEAVCKRRENLKRKREVLNMDNEGTRDLKTDPPFDSNNIFNIPKSGDLSKASALPESGAILKVSALPNSSALQEAGPQQESGTLSEVSARQESGALSESGAHPETSALSNTQTEPKFGSKHKHGMHTKNFQFRDIPVVAYVGRSKINQRNTNLKKHLKSKDLFGYYWKKFKYYKRHECDRQQILLDKIIFAVPQVDAALFATQMLTYRIEVLKLENCETEEGLRNRNSKMKWLMSRLVSKTMKMDSLLESIRCNVVMYTLEANSSNSKANGRLDKILKIFSETEECSQKSASELGTSDIVNEAGEHGVVKDEISVAEGGEDGVAEGGEDGVAEGGEDGAAEGGEDGAAEGGEDGAAEGGEDGAAEGGEDGAAEGGEDGAAEGGEDGAAEGGEDGAAEGGEDGAAEGGEDGAVVEKAEGIVDG